jgi:hypothetical protein
VSVEVKVVQLHPPQLKDGRWVASITGIDDVPWVNSWPTKEAADAGWEETLRLVRTVLGEPV